MKLDVEQVRKLYWDENKTVREVGAVLKVNHQTVIGFMIKNNIQRRSKNHKTKTRYSKKGDKMTTINDTQKKTEEVQFLLDRVPTTTRGKTIEMLEVRKETEEEFPIKTIDEYFQTMNQELDSIGSEYTGVLNKILMLETENKNSTIPSIRRQINKSKMVTLELEKQEIGERKTKQVKLLDDLKYGEVVIESITSLNSKIDEIQNMADKIHGIIACEEHLSYKITELRKAQKEIVNQVLKRYGLNKE